VETSGATARDHGDQFSDLETATFIDGARGYQYNKSLFMCVCVCESARSSHFKDVSPFRRASERRRMQENLIIHRPATRKRVKCKQSSDAGIKCCCLQHRSKMVKTKIEGPDTTKTVGHAWYCMGQQRGFTDCIMVVTYGCSKVDSGAKSGSVCMCSLRVVCVCVCVHMYVIMFSSGKPWR